MGEVGEWKEHARQVIAELKRLDDSHKVIESKLDQLLAFKYQIIGGSMVVSLLAAIAIQILSSIIK